MLKFGVFGYGMIADVHAEGLAHIDGAELIAVCGPREAGAREFAGKFGIEHVFTDPDHLLALDEIDGVLVDSPDSFHHDLVMRSAQAGKHIFCEKPLAVNVAEARAMYEAARQADLRTVVGFSSRWSTQVNNIRKLIEDDVIGEVVHVHTQSLNTGLVRSPQPSFTWRTDAKRSGTGILGDLGSHHIDLLHFLVGDITDVCADLKTFTPQVYDDAGTPHAHELDDDTIVLMQLENGAHGTMGLSRLGSVHSNYPVGRRHVMINGRKGGILFENGVGLLFRTDGESEPIEGEAPTVDKGHGGQLLAGATRQMQTFVDSVRENREITPTFTEGLKTQEVLHAVVESSKSRSWVAVERVG